MNHITDSHCSYCGSSLYPRRGRPHCSGDNLHATKARFDSVLELELSDPVKFGNRLEHIQANEEEFDLFMSYWNHKKKDHQSTLQCIHEETYYRSKIPEIKELPMPKSYIPFPDLAEVYIAEIMLGRELTGFEKDGRRYIPKINDNGNVYFAPLLWITYPRSYMSENKATEEIKDLEPLPEVFDMESIRGIYSGRDGEISDE